jgi:hypothetical protein
VQVLKEIFSGHSVCKVVGIYSNESRGHEYDQRYKSVCCGILMCHHKIPVVTQTTLMKEKHAVVIMVKVKVNLSLCQTKYHAMKTSCT